MEEFARSSHEKELTFFETVCERLFKAFTQTQSFNSLIIMKWILLPAHSLDEKKIRYKEVKYLAQGYAASRSWGSEAD